MRERLIRGGAYLAARETLGIVLRLAGVLALTRLLGPADFGVYAGSAAIVTFLGVVAQWGAEVFLIRREQEPSRELYEQTFSFLLLTAGGIALLALGVSFALELVAGPSPFHEPFRVLLIAVPLNVLWAPAQARIERSFRFRSMAFLELGGDAVLYGVSLALVIAGLGVWGPVCGYVAWQGFLLAASYLLARFRPRWRFSRDTAAELARFGLGFSSASWLDRGRELVNPLVVGPLMGPSAVGVVALALRLGETLGFVARATWRISIAALGRIQSDRRRLRQALEEGMGLQLLAGGGVLAGFSLVAVWAVPLLFGHEWDPALRVFPFVAVSYLLVSAFSLHSSLLYVLQRNARMVRVNAARLAALAIGAALLVPPFGLTGFGLAMLAGQLGYIVLDREVRKVFDYRFRRATPWLIALAPPLFAPLVGWPWALVLLMPGALVAFAPAPRAQLRRYALTVRGSLLRSGPEPA